MGTEDGLLPVAPGQPLHHWAFPCQISEPLNAGTVSLPPGDPSEALENNQ